MAKQKKFAKTPLLYINQPDISKPKAPMQSNYATPKKSKAQEPQKEQEPPKAQKTYNRPPKRNDFSKMLKSKPENKPENKAEEKAKKPKDTSKEDEEQSKLPPSDKKFNELTIKEKIEYFISKPKHLPTMKCEVKTEERSFRGTIHGLENDHVLMQVGRRSSTTEIAIKSIKNIRLVGF
ncbi:CotO family spore coat protein [Virgibacillus necropolis]|nr:CotO family spore coat protein [Virgibacillus necropolis]